MRMPNIDNRDLDRRVDDGKRSIGTDESRMEQWTTRRGGDDEEDPQKGELCSGQRQNKVIRTSDSGHVLDFFLTLSSSTCSMESAL